MLKLILLVVLALLAGCTGVPQGLQPVRDFELERDLGTWYEIARLDHPIPSSVGSQTYQPPMPGEA